MTELEIPIAIQTKGGPGAAEVLEWLPPSVWYISISFLDDGFRKAIEPGAPSIDERFDLMAKASKAGHRVVLGLNPCVNQWIGNPEQLISRAVDNGARGMWVEELHLHTAQIANMTQAERAAIGEDIIAAAKRRRRQDEESASFFLARQIGEQYGLEVFSNGQPYPSNIWDLYREVYRRTFVTNQDFINHCFQNDYHGKLIPFEIWRNVVIEGLPAEKFRMSKYLGASAMSLWEKFDIPSKLSYHDLLGIVWAAQRAKQSPVRNPAFAYAGLEAQNGWIQLVDGKDLPYLVYDRDGMFEGYYTPVIINQDGDRAPS